MEIVIIIIAIIVYIIAGFIILSNDSASFLAKLFFAPVYIIFFIGMIIMGIADLIGDIKEKHRMKDPEYAEAARKRHKQFLLEQRLKEKQDAENIKIQKQKEQEREAFQRKKDEQKSTKYIILDMTLDNFFAFRDKFPDRVISLRIHKVNNSSSWLYISIVFLLDGPLSFYDSKESRELQDSFSLCEVSNFVHIYEFKYCTGEKFKNDKASDAFIKSYIRQYMAIRPIRKFDISKNGACIRYW